MAECSECQGTGWIELLTSVRRCRSCPLGGGFEERVEPIVDELVGGGSPADAGRRLAGTLRGMMPVSRILPPKIDNSDIEEGWIADDGSSEVPF